MWTNQGAQRGFGSTPWSDFIGAGTVRIAYYFFFVFFFVELCSQGSFSLDGCMLMLCIKAQRCSGSVDGLSDLRRVMVVPCSIGPFASI